MLDLDIYGLNPRGHHLNNLLLHIINVLLVFLVFKQMTGKLWHSAFIAALFALHPLRVESVAWVTERKDVLSAFFWLLAMWAYSRYAERPELKRYLLVILCFSMGMMSKPMLVTMPFVLLLLDYWPLDRFQFKESNSNDKMRKQSFLGRDYKSSSIFHLVSEKIPLFVLSSILTFFLLVCEQLESRERFIEHIPIDLRISNALISYIGYLGKMIWPGNLSVFYPFPRTLPMWKIVGAAILLMCITLSCIRKSHRYPYMIVGWLWYLVTLFPVIGLVQWDLWPAMADRFTYIPSIGLFIVITWGIPDILSRWNSYKTVLIISSSVVLSALCICTWFQIRYWKNSTTLFEHALRVTRNNYIMHYNMGVVLERQGKLKEALAHYYETVRIKPDFERGHYNIGLVLAQQGKLKEAINHYSKAVKINPDYMEAHNNLGVALAQLGMLEKAIFHFSEAIRIKNDYKEARYNLQNALREKSKID
jgi:tetratricopeptide (TPR) repeat protein